LELGGSVIRIADPEGRWKFEARSAQVKAATLDGPYLLTPADGRYQETGKEPVLMRAARADVDRQGQRVSLRGSVRIASDAWLLEAERVDYDLKNGKVVSPGLTKLTFGQEAAEAFARQGQERGAR
jgi:lipopolysaccharide assembly outer membrane protein LptD (OstA)